MKNIVLHEDFLLMKYRQNAELNYEETPVISSNWMQGRRWDRPSMSTEQGSLSKISLLNFFWTSYILAFLAIICHSLNSYLRKTPKHLFPWKASRKVLVHAFENAHTVGLHIRLYIRVLLTQELWKNPALCENEKSQNEEFVSHNAGPSWECRSVAIPHGTPDLLLTLPLSTSW